MKRIGMSVLVLGLLLTACGEKTPDTVESEPVNGMVEASESALGEPAASVSASSEITADESIESKAEQVSSDTGGQESSELTEEQKTYAEIEDTFTDITLEEMQQKMGEKETALIYAGRLTCPYCVKFMPIFGDIAKERNLQVYSLDTEGNTAFDAFADEHGIEYVPALIYIKNGELTNLPLKSPYPRADVEKALDDVGLKS